MPDKNSDVDVTPLLAIQHVHRDRYGILRILEALFTEFGRIFSNLNKNDQFLYRSYIVRLIIQNVCQYVEDVGGYSVACKETGLLYAERVVSVTTGEIERFYAQVHKLRDSDIRRIFNIKPSTKEAPSFNYGQIRKKYSKLKKFRNEYQSLYNAMKHGNRVMCHEASTSDVPMNSLQGTFLTFSWIHVNMRKAMIEEVKAWDGSKIDIKLRDRKSKNLVLPSDDIGGFMDAAKDCHQIIERILSNNAPTTEVRI